MTHWFKCDTFSGLWRDPFLQLWQLFLSVIIFPNVTNFLSSVFYFSKWHFFLSVTHFSNCDTYFICDPFFQLWHTFLSVTHLFNLDTFFKCGLFFQLLPTCRRLDGRKNRNSWWGRHHGFARLGLGRVEVLTKRARGGGRERVEKPPEWKPAPLE